MAKKELTSLEKKIFKGNPQRILHSIKAHIVKNALTDDEIDLMEFNLLERYRKLIQTARVAAKIQESPTFKLRK